jgi:acyl-CoA reductase-like NAD-dependent aldehyde dehydrogenase
MIEMVDAACARVGRGDRGRCARAAARPAGRGVARPLGQRGLEHSSDVGAVISCVARVRIREWISRGEASGAKVVLGGREASSADPGGSYVGPTILDGVARRWTSHARRCSVPCCS